MNAFPSLTWEFSERSKSIDFMDMTISINNSNKIQTTLFKNDSTCTCTSLHTPPTRQAYFLVLCTVLCFEFFPYARRKKINYNKQRFFQRRIAHGYKGNDIRTLFPKAITRAKAYNGPATAEDDDHNSVIILHLSFHPNDPTSSRIQAAW